MIVSTDRLNESRAGIVVVVPCTTARRDLPSHVELDPVSSGLDNVSYAKCEDVKSISDGRLIAKVGRAPAEALFAVSRALGFILDL